MSAHPLGDGFQDVSTPILVPEWMLTQTAGDSTCPVCKRTWTVTPIDDCMLPACGCFGTDTSAANPARICQRCGLAHTRTCEHFDDE